MTTYLPAKSDSVIVRQLDGRIVCGLVMDVSLDDSRIALSRVSTLEVVGLRNKSEPIYQKKEKLKGVVFIPLESMVFWEKLPDYLKLDS